MLDLIVDRQELREELVVGEQSRRRCGGLVSYAERVAALPVGLELNSSLVTLAGTILRLFSRYIATNVRVCKYVLSTLAEDARV
jgi:hypothetical protein